MPVRFRPPAPRPAHRFPRPLLNSLALALVLGAAVCHATWNLVAKRAGGGPHFVLMGAVLVALLWAPLALWLGAAALPSWDATAWAVIGASAVVHILYFRTLLHGYAVADLTVVYPVARGSGPLLSTAGAVLLLGEALTPAGAAGALMVVGGVFLLAGGRASWRQAHDSSRRLRLRRGVGWGALTGVFIAGYTVIDAYAVKVLLIAPVLVDYVGNVLRVPIMLPFALRDRAGFGQAWRAQWRAALVVAVLGPLSYVMVLYAMRLAPLSHVAPAREVSLLFAALAGGTLLGEEDRAMRLAGAACIAAGVVVLALGGR